MSFNFIPAIDLLQKLRKEQPSNVKMGSSKNMNMNMIACLSLMVMVGLMQGATAAEYVVGDSLGWNVPANTTFYSDWAANKTFQTGDKLFFNWTGDHTVAEASKEEYDSCTNPGIMLGSPVTITLIDGGDKYYICTVGDHCENGQKLAITVNGTSISTSPPNSGAPATVASLLGLIISTLAVSFGTYM